MVVKNLALEDMDLSSNVTVTRNINSYSDIDLSFTPKSTNPKNTNEVRRDIFKKTDAASVKQSVGNILRTNNFEKPFEPFFGANVTSLLFDLVDDTTSSDIESQIQDALEIYEPRIAILNLQVSLKPDQNSCFVRLVFKVLNTNTTETIETTLSRLR